MCHLFLSVLSLICCLRVCYIRLKMPSEMPLIGVVPPAWSRMGSWAVEVCLSSTAWVRGRTDFFISLRRRHGENREVRSEKREPSPKNQDLTKVSLKRGKTRSQQYVVQGAKSSWGHTIYGHTYTEAYIIWQIYVYGICHMGFYDSSMSKCAAQANTWESLLLLRLAVVNAPSSSHPLPLRTPLQLSSCGSFRPLTLGQITAQFGNSSCLLA